MSEQNRAIVEQAYNNFKTGNIEALLNLLSDDVTWTLPEMEGVPFGHLYFYARTLGSLPLSDA